MLNLTNKIIEREKKEEKKDCCCQKSKIESSFGLAVLAAGENGGKRKVIYFSSDF